jgi:hypothetical protein
MKLITLTDKNEILETVTDEKTVLNALLDILWQRAMSKAHNIKRLQYQYNYSDKQKIKVTFTNDYKYIFEDIPTRHNGLDTDEIRKLLKGGE